MLLLLVLLSLPALAHTLLLPLALRRAASGCVAVALLGGGAIDVRAGNAALEGAARAMLSTKERTVEQRQFSAMPVGAQKRAALAACKDNELRKEAGMGSATECSRMVLDGAYGAMAKVLSGDVAPSVDSALLGKPSIQAETAVVKKSAPANALKAAKPVAKETLVKVTDLSDLSVAAKKRRALAACKKPPTRKFAAMGSESRCTEQVMKGEYGPIIEALEYGK